MLILQFCRQISFEIIVNKGGDCYDPIDNFDEGVELAVRLSSQPNEWIPVLFMYYHYPGSYRTASIYLGDRGKNFTIRGYEVEQVQLSMGINKVMTTICNMSENDSFQFRWLQTSELIPSVLRDVWIVDNIDVYYEHSNTSSSVLLTENFDNHSLK